MLIELQRSMPARARLPRRAATPKASSESLKHLKEINCQLVNYLQDENDTVDGWTSCFGCGFPTLVIFGRDGKRAATFEVTELPFEAATIEKRWWLLDASRSSDLSLAPQARISGLFSEDC